MRKLNVRFDRRPDDRFAVGTLAEDRGRVYFEYDPSFLARGLALSPLRLPPRPGLHAHRDRAFGPLPGLFDDSLPDAWGLLIMDRWLRGHGREPSTLTVLDRLAWLGTRTMGALTYHPAADPGAAGEGAFDLHALAAHARDLIAGKTTEVLAQLAYAGGSPGGARPKVLVGFAREAGTIVSGEDRLPPGHEPWIVKFAAREDGEDAGAVEQVYATMAREAGIAVPETRLFETAQGDRFFGARRFDREGDRRRHVHTFAGMIHADYRIPSVDYADLLKVVRALTRDHQQLVEAVRRVAFNVSSHNRDDHTKNISFVLDDENGEWTLAPAYDLTFAYGPGGEHSMTLHGEGRRPTADHVRALAKSVGLATHEVEDVLERVRAAVARWDERAADAGVSDDRRQEIGAAMARVVRR